LERASLLLLLGAIAAAVALFVALPLPAGGAERIIAAVAIVLADFAVCAMLWRAWLRNYHDAVEEELAGAKREIAQAERLASIGRMAAGVAHEVGNPLTGIANYTHVLRARAGNSAEATAALAGIEREVERVDRIVTGLLDFARPRPVPEAPFDAAASLRQAVQLLSEQGVFRTVHVQSSIADAPLAMMGNPHEFEQVFVNVLLNAIDAMQSKGTLAVYAGAATAETVARPPRRRSGDAASASAERTENARLASWRATHGGDLPVAKFVIADSGPGINPTDASRVFDPFYTTKDQGHGTGLGLAIVQRVVDSHDGVVWVQRAREGGAAFHLMLPLGGRQQMQLS